MPLLLWCGAFLGGCAGSKSVSVSAQDERLAYMGRVGKPTAETTELYWSGTSVKLNFEGTGVQARLKDNTGNSYYNVILDGDSITVIQPDTVQKLYDLAAQLQPGKHTLELFKRTEWDKGTTTFYGLELAPNTKLLPAPAPPKRRIEFYGNSITAGYAVHDYSGKDSWRGLNTDNYVSYAALTARRFNADYTCICKSGIGITVSWEKDIMPELFNRLNPSDPASQYDFSRNPAPDIVVINLLQNDSWIINLPNNAEHKRRFGNARPSPETVAAAYQNFVKQIRAVYPNAHIIAALGNMDIVKSGSVWPALVQKAVEDLQDSKIHTLVMPYKNTPGHPRVEEQQAMANQLITFIEEKIQW
ncbi:SGNH/GDSL hydrolase family protein [Rufibacter sp. LB8]|uniref:SGNH/GDSL hydrolase family protein n=1 Tax=Rufibacter sp. LB8 TaxID=2777781 RepID=UPI001CEF9378|nr:SGNH/GDSL hydrolase family protein [Rufibacter sp. LB8]